MTGILRDMKGTNLYCFLKLKEQVHFTHPELVKESGLPP